MKEIIDDNEELEGLSFESSLEELESLVDKLERGQMTLDESLLIFERGMKLARVCNHKLSKAERKIEILIVKNGKLKTDTFIDE
ncbi:exodeoxyribonuclease VII small subunit [Methanolobus psychrotolerans]|uniref:exodeoxyribonuclease VII small subunit n=1 Tax=Methanolobus psychrotolerans TaxID=1874706 RepID=UPI000B91A2F5|nr:exodeoxyribonuclease VII small subunit [Methanolobus psychrotolerans]